MGTLNQATRCLLGRLTKFTIYFLQLILNVRVNNRELWQFLFHEVYYNHDSQNSFSVYHDSRTPKMVDHGVTKMPLPSILGYNTTLRRVLPSFCCVFRSFFLK